MNDEEKLTPTEWEVRTGIKVQDPDGWRVDVKGWEHVSKEWDTPITRAEFINRATNSTVRRWPSPLWDEEMSAGGPVLKLPLPEDHNPYASDFSGAWAPLDPALFYRYKHRHGEAIHEHEDGGEAHTHISTEPDRFEGAKLSVAEQTLANVKRQEAIMEGPVTIEDQQADFAARGFANYKVEIGVADFGRRLTFTTFGNTISVPVEDVRKALADVDGKPNTPRMLKIGMADFGRMLTLSQDDVVFMAVSLVEGRDLYKGFERQGSGDE